VRTDTACYRGAQDSTTDICARYFSGVPNFARLVVDMAEEIQILAGNPRREQVDL
jgi:hypothetical protein